MMPSEDEGSAPLPPINTGAATPRRRYEDSKRREKNIKQVIETGLEKGNISKAEMEEALGFSTWESLQPFLNKAQGIHAPSPDNLVLAREEAPLHRSSFTPSELEKLKSLAPEEYELLR